MANEQEGILFPESLERLKGLLTPNMGYTDQEIQDAAFVFISTPLVAASVIGAADGDMKTVGITAVLSVPIIAEFINRGIIDPIASSRLLQDQIVAEDFAKG